MKTSALVSLLLTAKSLALEGEWGGCILKSNEDGGVVKRDKATAVCLSVGEDGDWASGVSYDRFSFKPIADEYSRYTVQGCK